MPTRVRRNVSRVLSADLVAGWRDVPTTIAADVLGAAYVASSSLRPLRPLGSSRLVGTAVTAWCAPGDFAAVVHAIEVASPGDVLLVAASSGVDAAVTGEILSGVARRKGVAGLAIDGAVRDTATLSSWPDFPVFARSVCARRPPSLAGGTVNEPISFAGVPARPGDLVLGDDDGLLVLPPDVATKGLADALAHLEAEHGWVEQLESGKSLVEVFHLDPPELID
jgi:4-hydroxy-4-methyl-2-oxoglutarate aldolase